MTGEQKSFREKLGAVFFAFIMVTSVVAIGSAAFAGTAAAAVNDGNTDNVNIIDAQPVQPDATDVTVEFDVTGSAQDVVIGIDADTDGTIQSDEVLTTQQNVGIGDDNQVDVTPTDAAELSATADTNGLDVVAVGDGNTDGVDDATPITVSSVDGDSKTTLDVDGVAPSAEGTNTEYLDTNTDGQVDEVQLDFDEDISSSTLEAGDFSFTNGEASDVSVDSVAVESGGGQDEVIIQVSSDPDDTNLGNLDVEYDASAGTPGSVVDAAGNTAGDVNNQDVTDSAGPVIISFTGNAGQATATLAFSEAVDDGTGSPVQEDDLSYTDVNAQGASFTTTATDLPGASAGDTTYTVPLDSGVITDDLATDTITTASASAVQDTNNDQNSVGNTITLTQQGLAAGPVAGAQYEIGGESDADVVAGSANESLGEIKLRDDSTNPDAAFAGQTQITFPEGITVNTSASSLSTTTVITSQNDGVDVTDVSVTNNDRTITIDHSGTSNNGEEIRIGSGSVVLSVDASQLDTSRSTTTLQATIDTFSGEAKTDFLILKTPRLDAGGAPTKETIAAGGEGLGGTSDVTIESGDIQAGIEGTPTALIGNQTDIVFSLESGTGITFDTDGITASNLISLTVDTDLDIDDDGTNEFDTSEITVSQKSITVPIVDSLDDSGGPTNGLVFQNQAFDSTGDATNTNLNVTIEAPSPSAGSYVSDSSSGSVETITNYVSVAKPDLNIANADDKLAVGLNQQYLTEDGAQGLQSGALSNNAPALEIVDTSGGQMANGENVTVRLNSSVVTFDTSQSVEVQTAATVNGDNGDALEVGIAQGGNGAEIADATIFSDRIEIQTQNADTADDAIIQLDDMALNVSNTASDSADVRFEVITKPSPSSPDVVSATTDSKVDGGSPSTEQVITLQRPETELSSGDGTAEPGSSANISFDVDGDGFTQQRVDSNGQNALVIDNIIDGQISDTTNVTISLEQGTGITFDTSASTSGGAQDDNTIDVSSGDLGISNVDILDSTTLNIEITDNTDGNAGTGADTQYASGSSVVIDDFNLNATGSASLTNISVTTNATVTDPTRSDVTDGNNEGQSSFSTEDNEVTTTLDAVLKPNQVDPSDVKVDPDRGDGTGFSNFAFGADQQINNPQVTDTITSGVKVRDGGSSFGGADVNLEIVQTPNGSSGSSVNTTVVTTNQNGEAFFNFTAGDTIGDYVVNASIDGVSGGVNVTYTAQSGGIDSVNVVPIENAIAGQGQGVSELGVAALFVNATDANGNPVEQTGQVSLSTGDVNADEIQVVNDRDADGSSDSVTGTFSGSFSLDSDGSSVVEVQTSNSGDVTIEAELSGNTDTGTVTFFDNVDTVDLSLNQTTADVDDRVAAEATIEGADGTAIEVPDVPITIEDDGSGNTTFDGDADSVSVTTDSTGVASATITAEQLGSADITAQTNLRSDTQTLSIDEEQPPTATVTFDDQTVANGSTSVNVASATFNGSEAFNIVVHQASDDNDDGTIQASEIGQKIGESAELESGTSTDILVNISKQVADNDNVSQLTANQTLVAMLHTTNTSDDDNIVHTASIKRDGTPVFDPANITVEEDAGDAPELTPDERAANFDEAGNNNGVLDPRELINAISQFRNGNLTPSQLIDLITIFQDGGEIETQT